MKVLLPKPDHFDMGAMRAIAWRRGKAGWLVGLARFEFYHLWMSAPFEVVAALRRKRGRVAHHATVGIAFPIPAVGGGQLAAPLAAAAGLATQVANSFVAWVKESRRKEKLLPTAAAVRYRPAAGCNSKWARARCSS